MISMCKKLHWRILRIGTYISFSRNCINTVCHVPYFHSKILFWFCPKLRNSTLKFQTKFWPENPESHSEIPHPSLQPHSEIPCQILSWNSDISLQNSIFFYQVHFRSILTFLTTFISILACSSWFPCCMIIYTFRGLLLFLLPLFPVVQVILPQPFSTMFCQILFLPLFVIFWVQHHSHCSSYNSIDICPVLVYKLPVM